MPIATCTTTLDKYTERAWKVVGGCYGIRVGRKCMFATNTVANTFKILV